MDFVQFQVGKHIIVAVNPAHVTHVVRRGKVSLIFVYGRWSPLSVKTPLATVLQMLAANHNKPTIDL